MNIESSGDMTSFLSTMQADSFRKVWTNPKADANSITVMTSDTLYVATLAESRIEAALKEMDGGKKPEEVLGLEAKVLPIVTIVKLKASLHTNQLGLKYFSKSNTFDVQIQFASDEDLDSAFTNLKDKLGENYKTRTVRHTAQTALLLPGVVLIGVLLFFGFILLVASLLAPDPSKSSSSSSGPGLLAPANIIAVGFLAGVGIAGWGIYRAMNPPVVVTMTKN